MKALRFVWNGLARNAGTKFMALLLALVLFVFVDQQNQETREIGELTLRFAFDETIAGDYLLLEDRITLTDLRIRGQSGRVAPLARDLNQRKQGTIIVTERMLQLVASGFEIPLTTRLLREAAILPLEVDIAGELPVASVTFAPILRRKMTLRIKSGQQELLTVPGDSSYLPADDDRFVRPRFNRESLVVDVVGPRDAFRDDSKALEVLVPNFAAVFQGMRNPDPGTPQRVPVAGIDWAGSGLETALIDHVRIDRMNAKTFAAKLELVFSVRPRLVPESLELAVVFLGELPNGLKLAEFDLQGVVGGTGELTATQLAETGRGKIDIIRPATVLQNQLEELRLIVDLPAAEIDPDAASFTVPAYLWTSSSDVTLLQKVRPVRVDGPLALSYRKK